MIGLATTPAALIHAALATQSKMVFGLAHLIDDTGRLQSYYTQSLQVASEVLKAHIILDNGVTETGSALSYAELRRRASLVGATEVVLPDVYRDAPSTFELVQQALPELDPTLRHMVVVHEQSIVDLFTTLQKLAQYDAITTIGIPKHQEVSPEWDRGRLAILRVIEDGKFHQRFDVHLLGVWKDLYRETAFPAMEFPWVRSIDTSWPVMAALHDVDITRDPTTKWPYEADPQGPWNSVLMMHNIGWFQLWAKGSS